MTQTGVADGLAYSVHDGPPDAETVLLSAGLGGSGAFWAPQMAALTRAFRVVLYDQRGTGRSARTLKEPHSVDAMADDMIAVLDAAGADKAHIVGHAAGGLAALSLALRYPARLGRLVVANGWSRPDPHIARCFAARIALLTNTGPAAYVRAQPLFLYPPNWISENHARLEAEEAHHISAFPAPEVMLARIEALLAFDIDARLGEIEAQVLVAASADDMLVPPLCSARLAEALPNGVLDVAPWGGHAFTATAAAAFNTKLVAFLRGDKL